VDTYSRSLFSYERRTNTFIAFASDLGLQPGQWPEAFELKDDTGSLTFNKVRDEVEGGELKAVHYATRPGSRATLFND
jgi:hypothetical protein